MMNNLQNKEVMAKNIRYYLKLSRKTRKQLCRDLNLPYSTFTDWCCARKYPRIDKIEMMASYFGIEKSDLIEDAMGVMNEFNVEVGDRIKFARKRKRMSMKELGEKVSLHESTISRYEKGEIMALDVGKLKEFAKALDVPQSYLMGLDEKSKIESTTRFYQIWNDVVGNDELTEDEFERIAHFAKFIISERKTKDGRK